MEVFFHISWRLSFAPEGYCDQSVVDSGILIGSGELVCQHGCSETAVISSMAYRCTDFSIEEDWTFGENQFTHTFQEDSEITIGFTGGDWLSPFDAEWNISTTFSTTKRNDTGRINSTPRVITNPVLRLQADCNHIVSIPVYDPENDIVKCRWAVGTECAGICGQFPGAELDSESCSISHNANQGEGHQVAAIMIEDFLPGSTDPMSSVGLQFIVLVFESRKPCSVAPNFIPPTLSDESCVAIPSGATFHTMVIAVGGNSEDTITEIQTVSPAGMEKSDLLHDEQLNAFYINITWTPTSDQENDVHLFCFTATNSAGLSTSQVCIELLPGHTSPTPIPESATPHMGTVHPFNTTWHITFDRDVVRPSIPAYFTFHEVDTSMKVHRIDASSSSEIVFDNGNGIDITPAYHFEEKREFYINFERGVVVSLDGCRPGNEPVTGRAFWIFETLDVTPPSINFLMKPSVTNVNITLTWESDESNVTWHCNLITELVTLEQECPDGVWNGLGLPGGVYRLEVSGTDLAENTAVVVHNFIVDVTPPIASITRFPPEFSNRDSFLFRFSCNEVCTFQCQFQESNDTEELYFPCNIRRFVTPSLSHGKRYVFSVMATDQVGNIGEPVSHIWETDFVAPMLYGVMNVSVLCTGDFSPSKTGQAQAVDDRTAIVGIRFRDQRMMCSITRTWRATDSAGNVGVLAQYITLEFMAALNFLLQVLVPCDSSTDSTSVPTNTAKLQNPCRRPLQLDYEDSVNEYMCPIMFARTWTVTDECNQETSSFEQTISLYDLCPIDACGRNESTPHGICVQGSCICNDPWFGDNCEILAYSVQLGPVNDHVLLEYEDYSETLTVIQGSPPLIFSLISSPDRMVIIQETGEIIWRRAQAGNYTITVEVRNLVSAPTVTWSIHVEPGYTASLEPVPQSLFSRAAPVELRGNVEYFGGNIVEKILNGFVPVTIEVDSRNGRREITVFSREDGTFSGVFYPAPTEYGSYVAGVKHPHVARTTQQITWDFLGMKATPRILRLRDSTVAEFETTFYNVSTITNDGPRALHGITVRDSVDSTEDLKVEVKLNGSLTLEINQSSYIDIEVKAKGALDAIFTVIVESVEGVMVFLSVNLKIKQILPDLIVSPSSINRRVIRGTFRNLDFNVTNVGTIPAHMVRAVLPMTEYLSLVSFGSSLQQTEEELTLGSGESAMLSILATIPADQPLGDISGQIVISSVETYEVIYFNVIVSSNVLMNLTVAVEDEYTYFAEGLPSLSDAVVRLTNNKRDIQEVLTTDESGTVTFFNILEDRYELFVTGPSHVPFKEIILTSPEEPLYTVFLARISVSYTFSVVPAVFQETYTVTLEADFVTHVPIPVVTIEPREISLDPYELGLKDTIQYNITNHGLIRANDFVFQLPDGHPFLGFSTPITDLGDIEPLSSIIITVYVSHSIPGDEDDGSRSRSGGEPPGEDKDDDDDDNDNDGEDGPKMDDNRNGRSENGNRGDNSNGNGNGGPEDSSCIDTFYTLTGTFSYVCRVLQVRTTYAVVKRTSRSSGICESFRGSGFGRTLGDGGVGSVRSGGGGGFRYQFHGSGFGIILGGEGGGGGSFGSLSIDVTFSSRTPINCEMCLFSALGCLPVPIPLFSCLHFVVGTVQYGFSFNNTADHASWVACLQELHPSRLLRRITPFLCLPGVLRDCFGIDTSFDNLFDSLGRRKRSIRSTVANAALSFYAMHQFTFLGIEVLGDERWVRVVNDATWLRDVFRPVLSDVSDAGSGISNDEYNFIMSVPPPRNATVEMVKQLLERFNNTFNGWNNGILEPENGTNMMSFGAAEGFTRDLNFLNERIVSSENSSFLETYNHVIDQYNLIEDFEEEGVCAVVRLRIEQEIALTRDAFLAKLEIENMEASDITRWQMEILITNSTSAEDKTLLFSIGDGTLTGSLMDGESGLVLPSGKSGAIEWLIVPLSEAAPTENQEYSVGGTMSYTVNNETLSIPLIPTRITVAPDPSLIIHYFWGKFVVGDNPFTDETEPSVPFALGVAIHNAGYGVAMNLHITSGQPEIIDNDKGLLVTFKIIGTRLGNESVTPSLSVDFGDIPAMTTKVARWFMISSLQGEFMNYSATFEYMNPLGDPRLSVLDELVIHDLIRNVQLYLEGENDGVLDFLVNDIEDLFSIPDALYSSKTFTRYNVSVGYVESVERLGPERLEVHVVCNSSGWVYFQHDITSIRIEIRQSFNLTKFQSDETVYLPPENAWISGDVQGNSRENFLHIIDFFEDIGEVTYMLSPCTLNCPLDVLPFLTAEPPGKIHMQLYIIHRVYITLHIAVPPINIEVEAVGSTWIILSWEQVPTLTAVSSQIVRVNGGGSVLNISVDASQSNMNITDLQSGVLYALQVIAVAENGEMSFPSVAVTGMTIFSRKVLVCTCTTYVISIM